MLLLYLSVGLERETFGNNVRSRLRECWEQSRLGIQHIDDFLDRQAQRSFEGRWEWTERYGWTNDGQGSPRNPRSVRGSAVLTEIKRFFGELS